MKDNLEHARLFKALCDEQRLSILDLLRKSEKCACDLLEDLPISQSTLSHHMKILVESSLVYARKDKKWTYYGLQDEGLVKAQDALGQILHKDHESYSSCQCD